MPMSYTVAVPRTTDIADMLRRDRAEAASKEDQLLINRLCDKRPYDRHDLPKIMHVSLFTDARYGPLVKRWESFGCKVISCSDPTVVLSDHTPTIDKITRHELEMNQVWAMNNPYLFVNEFFKFVHEHDGDKVSIRLPTLSTVILVAEPKTEMECEAEIS